MSGDSKNTSFSESLVLDDSEKGVIITGITDDTIAAKSGLQAGDEIVAATIHLDHLNKNEVLNILKVLEPYDNNMKVLTKKDLKASADFGSLGLDLKDPAEMLGLKKDLSLDTSAKTPAISLGGQSGKLYTEQGLGGEINGTTLNGDLPNLNLIKPSADGGANFTMPSLGLTGPDIKGDLDGTLKAPDANVSTPQLNTPSASLNIEKPEMKTGNQKYKAPKFHMPHFSLPQFKTPKADMDISGDVDLPSVSGNLETPDLNMSAPNVDLNGCDAGLEAPNADIKASTGKIKWPHLKWKGPKVKGPDADLNADLSTPDVSLSTVKIDGDVNTPDLDINSPKTDIKGPDLDIETPNLDTGKFKWPHLKLRKPKIHDSKADLDVDAHLNPTDVDLSVSKVEGGINTPDIDINMPKADIKGPDLDMQAPHIDEAPGKINWPHLKWKKPKGPKADLDLDGNIDTPDLNLSTQNIEAGIDVPNAELNLPKADLKGPGIDVHSPDLDIDAQSGKIQWPHLKWKKPKFHGPKADVDVNTDLSTPDVDVSVPRLDGEISPADVDVNLPEANIEAPSGKIKFPTIKKPKFLISGTKVKSPDVDLDTDMKAPDLSLSPQASLDVPDVNLNLPEADVNAKAPTLDIDASPGKIKWPTLKKPRWSFSGPKLNSSDIDLDANVSSPDLTPPTAKIGGEINAPEANLSLPKADLESPNIDINAPDIESPSGKFKWFNFKKPKFGTLKGSKIDTDADVKVPDVDLKAADVNLSAPDVNLSAPEIKGGFTTPDLDISMPSAEVKGPDADVTGPVFDLEAPKSKLNLPKLKLPDFTGTKVKGPALDADLKAPDIDVSPNVDLKAPDLSLSTPKIKGGLDTPDLNLNLPNTDLNGTDVDLQGPEVGVSSEKFKLPKIKFPKIDLSGPKVKGSDVDADLKSSGLNLSAPTVKGDLSIPDIDTDANFKTDIPDSNTKINLPDFSLSVPKINSPDADLSLPKADVKGGSLDLPTADIQVHDPKLQAPDLSLSPSIDTNFPKAELETPDVMLEAPNADINLTKANLEGPDGQLSAPNVDSHLGDFKLPHFKLPKFGFSSSDAKCPPAESGVEIPKVYKVTPTADADISVPSVNLSAPQVDSKITEPAVDVDVNLKKSKLPDFQLSKFSELNIKAPGTDTNANLKVTPDVKVQASNDKEETNLPSVSASAPEVQTGIKGSPKSKLRWPFKWGFKSGSGTDEEGSGADSETDVSNVEVEVPAFKIHTLPKNSIVGIGGVGDTLSSSKLETEAKDYVVSKGIRLPVVNATSKAGEKIDIMERLKMAKEKATSICVSPIEAKTDGETDTDLKLPAPSVNVSASADAGESSLVRGGTFKVEKPESILGVVAPEISTSDENDKMSVSLSNMLCLDVKDSDAE